MEKSFQARNRHICVGRFSRIPSKFPSLLKLNGLQADTTLSHEPPSRNDSGLDLSNVCALALELAAPVGMIVGNPTITCYGKIRRNKETRR